MRPILPATLLLASSTLLTACSTSERTTTATGSPDSTPVTLQIQRADETIIVQAGDEVPRYSAINQDGKAVFGNRSLKEIKDTHPTYYEIIDRVIVTTDQPSSTTIMQRAFPSQPS